MKENFRIKFENKIKEFLARQFPDGLYDITDVQYFDEGNVKITKNDYYLFIDIDGGLGVSAGYYAADKWWFQPSKDKSLRDRMTNVNNIFAIMEEKQDVDRSLNNSNVVTTKETEIVRTIDNLKLVSSSDHYHGPVHIKVKKLDSRAKMPFKKPGQEENFCFDVFAIEKKEIAPGTFEYRTGLAFEIEDHELKEKYILSIDARPRSSVSETGLVLCNCTGTIDDPYRGEVKARFYQVKEGPEYKPYEPGDRVIQIKIGLTPRCEFIELGEGEELSETVRGQGGFGSSGRK